MTFLVSRQEKRQIKTAYKLSGMSRQDYLVKRALCKDVNISGNFSMFYCIKSKMESILKELKRIEAGQNINAEVLDDIDMITKLLYGLKEEKEWIIK